MGHQLGSAFIETGGLNYRIGQGPEIIKLFFMLNSIEHEFLNTHEYKNIKKFVFLGSDKPSMLCFPPINVKNANNCWHFKIYEQEKFHAQLS